MHAEAQTIISSHKNAGKRAVSHLLKTRNLKLSVAESYELVACILQGTDWNTLLAMAKKGEGPGTSLLDAAPATVATPVKDSQTIEETLIAYFGGNVWHEHPDYPRSDWANQVENGDTNAAYWSFVANYIEMMGEYFPWERDVCLIVKICKAAGKTVQRFKGEWWVFIDGEETFALGSIEEKDAWSVLYTEVLGEVLASVDQEIIDKMSDEELIKSVSRYYPQHSRV